MSFKRVFPQKIFETTIDSAIPIKTVFASIGSGTTSDVIGAATGQRHRIVGGIFQGDTTTSGRVDFKSKASAIRLAYFNPPVSSSAPLILPMSELGYFETATGEILECAVTTAACNFTLFYITYTP